LFPYYCSIRWQNLCSFISTNLQLNVGLRVHGHQIFIVFSQTQKAVNTSQEMIH